MEHGSRSMYNLHGCRCDACRKANTAYQIKWQRFRYGSKPRKFLRRRHPAEYQAWANAKQRTTNPKNPLWEWYGRRGIKMCAEWLNSFETFYAHIGPRPEGLSLDRIDNNRDYEPGNVRWITQAEQCRNRRQRSP